MALENRVAALEHKTKSTPDVPKVEIQSPEETEAEFIARCDGIDTSRAPILRVFVEY